MLTLLLHPLTRRLRLRRKASLRDFALGERHSARVLSSGCRLRRKSPVQAMYATAALEERDCQRSRTSRRVSDPASTSGMVAAMEAIQEALLVNTGPASAPEAVSARGTVNVRVTTCASCPERPLVRPFRKRCTAPASPARMTKVGPPAAECSCSPLLRARQHDCHRRAPAARRGERSGPLLAEPLKQHRRSEPDVAQPPCGSGDGRRGAGHRRRAFLPVAPGASGAEWQQALRVSIAARWSMRRPRPGRCRLRRPGRRSGRTSESSPVRGG